MRAPAGIYQHPVESIESGDARIAADGPEIGEDIAAKNTDTSHVTRACAAANGWAAIHLHV